MTDIGVIAERIAAVLGTHEPGWQLPRATELARRYNTDIDQVNAIIDDLVARQLVRRSPNGRLFRASPPECLIALDGIPGLGTAIDPMSGDLTCLSYGASRRPATEEAADALHIRPGEPVCVLRLAWALNGRPAAVSTTYLARHLAEPHLLTNGLTTGARRSQLPLPPLGAADDRVHLDSPPGLWVHSASIQMQLPPSSLARKLRLAAGQLAVLVTVLSGDVTGRPAVLTTAVLRPDMFRITIAAEQPDAVGRSRPAAWSLAAPDDGP